MVCASPKNSKKRRTILCSCVHLLLKENSQSRAYDSHFIGSGNAEIFRHGIHWSKDRILLCKNCNSLKNINFTYAKCFLWWSTLNEPPNPRVQDIFYDYNTNKSVVFKWSNEKGQYWPPLKLEGTPCFHATPSCHVFTRGKSIDLHFKNKARWVCLSQPVMPSVNGSSMLVFHLRGQNVGAFIEMPSAAACLSIRSTSDISVLFNKGHQCGFSRWPQGKRTFSSRPCLPDYWMHPTTDIRVQLHY